MNDKAQRDREQKNQIIYGLHSVIEAVLSGKEIEKVYVRKELYNDRSRDLIRLLKDKRIPFQLVPNEKLQRISRKNHQGVIAFLSLIEYSNIENLVPGLFEKGKVPFIIALDGITDVRNMGAIARTAECTGVNGLIFPEKGSAQINEDAIKTSSGALHILPVCRTRDLVDSIIFLKESGLKIIAACEKGEYLYHETDLNGPITLVFGSEEKGISDKILHLADTKVKIPLMGKVNSLNVSVAAAVLMYEIVRQRRWNPC